MLALHLGNGEIDQVGDNRLIVNADDDNGEGDGDRWDEHAHGGLFNRDRGFMAVAVTFGLKPVSELDNPEKEDHIDQAGEEAVSYTHLTLPTTPYV